VGYAGPAGLSTLLRRSEILVCLLPLTAATEGILSARLLARLPRGAALVNTGRGGHLVEADLIPALDSGQLSGAVLDVFREEPLPKGHPFWSHPRIIVTPHIAAETHPPTAAATSRRDPTLRQGEPIANLVDLATGY
jgi:glyoxylate/hydroxypyruvate reductase A